MPPYQCHDCNKTFPSQQALEQHTRDKDHGVECDYCDRVFRSTEACSQHEAAVHSHGCDNCDMSFNSAFALEQHKRDKHPSFECDYCDRVFRSAEACEQHESAVHPSYNCDECSKTFSSSDALEQHKRDKHPSFECDYCDSVFRSAEACEQHESAVHPSYNCDKCSKTFSSSDALGQHKRDKHPFFECDHCDSTFRSAEACEQHKSAVHPSYKCYECSKTFSSSDALGQHKRDKHPSFQCRYCCHTFRSVVERSTHETTTHATHGCEKCGSRFFSVGALEEHKRIRHPSFKCNYCFHVFVSTEARDQHADAAHPMHLCNKCDKGFSSLDVLKEHKQEEHPSYQCNFCDFNFGSTDARDQHEEAAHPCLSTQSDDQFGSIVVDHSCTEQLETLLKTPDLETSLLVTHSSSNAESVRESPDTDEEYHDHARKSHGSQIPIHCSYCYSRFEDEDALEKHLGERERFSCKMCSLQLCSQPMLQDHLESHPTCRECGKLFGNEAELYRHMDSAHPIVVCWDCNGTIISQQSLSLHYASEHPSCPICNLRMKSPNMLDEHINNEHDENPEGSDKQCSGDGQSDSLAKSLYSNGSGPPECAGSSVSSESHPSLTPPSSHGVLDEDANATVTLVAHLSEEGRDELYQTAPPSPTPSVNGSNITKSEAGPVAQGTLRHPQQLESPGSSLVITESYDGMSDGLSLSSSSQSIVYVTADLVPEHIRNNRAYLVATSAPSQPSSGSTSPVRLPSAISSLDSLELVPEVLDSSTPSTVGRISVRNQLRLHCRICNRDPCANMTATICGHIFCKSCITQAVVSNSECPVCKSATLLYCLFRLDLTA